MLVSATEMINKAHEGHYAIGAFNINNLEWTKAILAAAEEVKSPVMLGVSEGAAKYMCGFKTVVAMVKEIHDYMGITVPVAIHLDHGTYEGAKAAIEAGFTSVMFDVLTMISKKTWLNQRNDRISSFKRIVYRM